MVETSNTETVHSIMVFVLKKRQFVVETSNTETVHSVIVFVLKKDSLWLKHLTQRLSIAS